MPRRPNTSRNVSSGSHASSIASNRSSAASAAERTGAKPSTSHTAASCASTKRRCALRAPPPSSMPARSLPASLKPPRKRGVRSALSIFSSSVSTLASSSPTLMACPSAAFHAMVPDALAIRGICIFITSISAYEVPSTTRAPSATRQRASLPLDGAVKTLRSISLSSRHRRPSMTMRVPAGSSCAYTTWLAPSRRTSRPPSRRWCASSCTSARSCEAREAAASFGCETPSSCLSSPTSSMRTVQRSGPTCFTSTSTRNPRMTSSWLKVVSETLSGGIWPRSRKVHHSARRALASMSERYSAPQATARSYGGWPSGMRRAIRSSSQPV